MDRMLIQPGVRALAAEHWNWMQDGPRKAIAGLVSDLTDLSPSFYISGCEVTTATIGPNTEYTIQDGWVCFEGEVMPVVGHTIMKGVLQQVYLVVEDVGVDTIPVPDLNGNQYEVMRRRRAKLQVSNTYPGTYMAIDAPRREELLVLQLKGRVVPKGSILPYHGPLTSFDNTGMGSSDMLGWAICNGNNSTPDLRGLTVMGATNVPDSGASALYAGVASATNVGDLVGEEQTILTEDQLPAHSHDLDMGASSYISASGGSIGTAGGTGNSATAFPAATEPIGAGQPVENRQPSFALVFIMSLL
jgi:microcystin-dependent protein